ncbi:anti-sigma factor [Gordonia sp. NPDC003429]
MSDVSASGNADELVGMAPLVALHVLPADELDAVVRHRADADADVRDSFDREVRATREAMASMSAATATAPPPTLRDRILAAASSLPPLVEPSPLVEPPSLVEPSPLVEPVETTPPLVESPSLVEPVETTAEVVPLRRRRAIYLAAAAVVAIAVGAVGWLIGTSVTGSDQPTPNTAEQVFAAKDVRSTSGDVATGRATVTFSDTADAGVLVMNDVPPPKSGTVYQMWLVGPDGATSAGTMTDKDVAPSTTAVIPHIGNAKTLAFTVEPPGGSAKPTGAFVAELPLT